MVYDDVNCRDRDGKHFVGMQMKPETKTSSHEGQCIPTGSSVSLPRRVLITVSIITILERYFPQTMHPIVYAL